MTNSSLPNNRFPDRRHPYRLAPEMYQVPGQVVFVTLCVQGEVNLTEEKVTRRLLELLRKIGRRWEIEIRAYCVMPDHLHVVVSTEGTEGDLQKWLRYAKRESAKLFGEKGRWQRSYWDRHARSYEDLKAMVEYVLSNPVRRGLCAHWQEWPFLWSEWHSDGGGKAGRGEGKGG